MLRYQSFPGISGDSLSLDKLIALRLPSMSGQTFLDVGCNEGFFCGYAKHSGAVRVVGLDHSAAFIGRARGRFPDCDFYCQGWSCLPDGEFDVILLASALHYADDQPALVKSLMGKLARGGTLVLELGVVSQSGNQWVEVTRGIDKRLFPTWDKLEEVLQGYAWKHMGPSVSQSGDPVRRHVIHIRHRLPVVYLLTSPPGCGKSSIARSLFAPAGMRVVSSDSLVADVVAGRCQASDSFKDIVTKGFSHLKIDEAFVRIFERGCMKEWVDLCVRQAGDGDFAVDGYVPPPYVLPLEEELRRRGYMVVKLDWQRVGGGWRTLSEVKDSANAYYSSLRSSSLDSSSVIFPFAGVKGFVDSVEILNGELVVRGWALSDSGRHVEVLAIDVPGERRYVEIFSRQARPDVVKHFGGGDLMCGFEFAVAHGVGVDGLLHVHSLKLYGGVAKSELCGPFGFSAGVNKSLTFAI